MREEALRAYEAKAWLAEAQGAAEMKAWHSKSQAMARAEVARSRQVEWTGTLTVASSTTTVAAAATCPGEALVGGTGSTRYGASTGGCTEGSCGASSWCQHTIQTLNRIQSR